MVQDFAFESSTILYILQMNGVVQKMPYTGTAWASSLNSVSTKGSTGHTIEAMAPDKVLTGQSAGSANTNVMSLSTDGGVNYAPMSRMPGGLVPSIGYHVLFDTDFTKNATVYIASDLGFGANGARPHWRAPADTAPPQGLVYRNVAPAGSNTEWTDMMTNQFFIGYCWSSSRLLWHSSNQLQERYRPGHAVCSPYYPVCVQDRSDLDCHVEWS